MIFQKFLSFRSYWTKIFYIFLYSLSNINSIQEALHCIHAALHQRQLATEDSGSFQNGRVAFPFKSSE